MLLFRYYLYLDHLTSKTKARSVCSLLLFLFHKNKSFKIKPLFLLFMSNHLMQRQFQRKGLVNYKKKRLKTFKSEESARSYAEKNNIKKYSLRNLRLNPDVKPKFQIIVEE